MIATVLTIGALLAPLLAWNDGVARNAGDRSQTVRLPDLPKQGTLPRPTAESFAADRPGHLALQRVREALDGAVGEPGGEGEIAGVQPEPLGLAAEGPIGPRAVLEDPPQDGIRGAAGGRGHRTDVQIGCGGSSPTARLPT